MAQTSAGVGVNQVFAHWGIRGFTCQGRQITEHAEAGPVSSFCRSRLIWVIPARQKKPRKVPKVVNGIQDESTVLMERVQAERPAKHPPGGAAYFRRQLAETFRQVVVQCSKANFRLPGASKLDAASPLPKLIPFIFHSRRSQALGCPVGAG